MNNNVSVKIAVAETSVIIRSGLTTVLKRLPNLNVVPIEVSSPESLQSYIHLHTPDLWRLVQSPSIQGRKWESGNQISGTGMFRH